MVAFANMAVSSIQSGQRRAMMRGGPAGGREVQNPLDRFDISALWNEEHDGIDAGNILSDLLAVVHEELERVEKEEDGDILEGPTLEVRQEHRSHRERQLDRMLKLQSFSHADIEDTTVRLREIVDELSPQEPDDGVVHEHWDSSPSTSSPSGSPPQWGSPFTRANTNNLKSLQLHASDFSGQLMDVLEWLERRRAREEDAIDLYREQVLLRAEGGGNEQMSRRRSSASPPSKRPSMWSEKAAETRVAATSESEGAIAEEVSARTDTQQVLEALDILEMEMQSTLSRFYEQIQTLSKPTRARNASKASSIQPSVADPDGTDNSQQLAELRRTVTQLKMQLVRAQEASGDAEVEDDDPSAELLRLFEQSAEQKDRSRELKLGILDGEDELGKMRTKYGEVKSMHEEAQQQEAELREQAQRYKRERREALEAHRLRIAELQKSLLAEAEAAIDFQVKAAKSKMESEFSSILGAGDAPDLDAVREANGDLRKHLRGVEKELEDLQAVDEEGLPPQLTETLSRAQVVSGAGSQWLSKARADTTETPTDPPQSSQPQPESLMVDRPPPSTAQLKEMQSRLQDADNALHAVQDAIPAKLEANEDEGPNVAFAAHPLLLRIRSEMQALHALYSESLTAAKEIDAKWGQMGPRSMELAECALTKVDALKGSMDGLQFTLHEAVSGDEAASFWHTGLLDTRALSKEQASALVMRASELEASIEQIERDVDSVEAARNKAQSIVAGKEEQAIGAAASADDDEARARRAEEYAATSVSELAAVEAERASTIAKRQYEEDAGDRRSAREQAVEAAATPAVNGNIQRVAMASMFTTRLSSQQGEGNEETDRDALVGPFGSNDRGKDSERVQEFHAAETQHIETVTTLSECVKALADLEDAVGGKNLRKLGRAALVGVKAMQIAAASEPTKDATEVEVVHEAPAAALPDNEATEMTRAIVSSEAHVSGLVEHLRNIELDLITMAEATEGRQALELQRARVWAAEKAVKEAEEELNKAEAYAASVQEAQQALRQSIDSTVSTPHPGTALQHVPESAQGPGPAVTGEEEMEEEPTSLPSNSKDLEKLVERSLQQKSGPSAQLLSVCSEAVTGIESELREALKMGQQLANEAKRQKAERAAARMARDFRQKELDRLTKFIQEAEALRKQALDKYGNVFQDNKDNALTRQLCRVMLERDRIMALIKQHSATVTVWRFLWSMSQRSRKPKAARHPAANAGTNPAVAVHEGDSGPGMADALEHANKSTEFWRSATRTANQLADAANALQQPIVAKGPSGSIVGFGKVPLPAKRGGQADPRRLSTLPVEATGKGTD
jgi:hypothetical protein